MCAQARIPRPGQVPGGTDPVVGDGRPLVEDKALEKLAHFSVTIGDGVLLSTRAAYSRRSHRYRRDFASPGSFRLYFSARDGLAAYRNRRVAIRRDIPDQAIRLQDWLDGRGGGDPAPPEGEALVPDWVNAFVWTVKEVGGRFSSRKIVNGINNVSPLPVSSLSVPHQGTYDVSLRVVTDDSRFFERTIRVSFKHWVLASIGDSFASGQGNPAVVGTPGLLARQGLCQTTSLVMALDGLGIDVPIDMAVDPEWLEPLAHRSLLGPPALAAQGLDNIVARSRHGQVHDLDVVTFITVARSGAKVVEGLIDPQEGNDDYRGIGQLDELAIALNGRTVDVLMISVGGNDAGFAGVLADLVAQDSVLKSSAKELLFTLVTGIPIGGNDAAERDRIRARLAEFTKPGGELAGLLKRLRAQVEAVVPPGTGDVYHIGYPIWMFDTTEAAGYGFKADGVFDGPDMDVTGADYRNVIIPQGERVNQRIKENAQESGWTYVEPSEEFRGRGYSSAAPLWVGAEYSCLHQGDFDGTMHPNAEGCAAQALQLIRAIKTHSM